MLTASGGMQEECTVLGTPLPALAREHGKAADTEVAWECQCVGREQCGHHSRGVQKMRFRWREGYSVRICGMLWLLKGV